MNFDLGFTLYFKQLFDLVFTTIFDQKSPKFSGASRRIWWVFYFRTKFEMLTWVLLVNLSKILTWFLLVNLTKNAQNFPALRAESVGVLLLFCEISPKKVGVLLFEGGVLFSIPRYCTEDFCNNIFFEPEKIS